LSSNWRVFTNFLFNCSSSSSLILVFQVHLLQSSFLISAYIVSLFTNLFASFNLIIWKDFSNDFWREARQKLSSSLFNYCSTWIVAASIIILGFMGQLLLYHNLSLLNFNLLHWLDIVSLFSRLFWTLTDLKCNQR